MNALPVPQNPLYAIGSWEAAEQKWNREFPACYKSFVEHYGQGQFAVPVDADHGFLWFPSPFGEQFSEFVEHQLQTLRQDLTFKHLDELLPVASSDNGDTLCLLPMTEESVVGVVDDHRIALHPVPCDNSIDYVLTFLGERAELYPGYTPSENLQPFRFLGDPTPVPLSEDSIQLSVNGSVSTEEMKNALRYARSLGYEACCRRMAELKVNDQLAWRWVQHAFPRTITKRDFKTLWQSMRYTRENKK